MGSGRDYTPPKFIERVRFEFAYERMFEKDICAELDHPHYSHTEKELQLLNDLRHAVLKKISILKVLLNDHEENAPSSELSVVSNEELDTNYESGNVARLGDRLQIGMLAYQSLSEVQQLRIQAAMYVQRVHGSLKITPNTLHFCPPSIRSEIRAFLQVLLGDTPKARTQVNEVLRAPKKSRVKTS